VQISRSLWVRELERGRMRHLERRREVECLELACYRLSDLARIEDLPAIDRTCRSPAPAVVGCLGLTVGREGQPQRSAGG
jgi:hypothetical protein